MSVWVTEGHTLKPAALKCALAADCKMERATQTETHTIHISWTVRPSCNEISCLTYPLHPVGVVTWLPCQGLAPLLYTEREQVSCYVVQEMYVAASSVVIDQLDCLEYCIEPKMVWVTVGEGKCSYTSSLWWQDIVIFSKGGVAYMTIETAWDWELTSELQLTASHSWAGTQITKIPRWLAALFARFPVPHQLQTT